MNKLAKRQIIVIEVTLAIALLIHLLFDSNIETYFVYNFVNISIFGIALALLTFIFAKVKFIINIIDYAKIAFVSLVLLNTIQTFIVMPVLTEGESMVSTLHDGDFLLARITKDINKNDIVIVNHNGSLIVKRVIATEGDNLYVENDELFINGKFVDEYYLDENQTMVDFDLSNLCFSNESYLDCSNGIPKGYYLVMGDNRVVSYDSRNFGLVKEEDIYAKTIFNFNEFLSN